MKLLHVASGRLFGGIERMLVTIARCAPQVGPLEHAFAVAAPGRLLEELRAAGASSHFLGDVRISRPASVLEARSRLRGILRTEPTHAVVCHAPWAYSLFAGTARRAGVRVVLWQHDWASGVTMVERWARRVPAQLVICNSRWTAASAGVLQPAVPVEVLHGPVAHAPPQASRAAVRASLDADDSEVVLLTASRLEPWKGHATLLDALSALKDGPSWRLWIAGGPQRAHERGYLAGLQRQASRLGLADRVRFLGERRDMPDLMAASDLLVQANVNPEPLGVVFAEALLSGLPVVASNLGGTPEIVDVSCGRFVAAGDSAMLASTIAGLLADPALRARLGAAGPPHAAARCAPGIVLRRLGRVIGRLSSSAAS